jgi:hypothetical protein
MFAFGNARAALLCAAMAALVPGAGAQAKNRALLIGASEYTRNDSVKDLNGPRNDVTIMWRYLKSSGYADEDIVVLTDGLPENDAAYPRVAGRAEYARIIAELDRLATHDYGSGDLVVVFYAGHGTTLKDSDPAAEREPESRGMDQILLPVDVGPAKEGGNYENMLIDDEFGEKLTAIRKRGVNVWAILDACQSGGGTRGGEESRYVSPTAFGFTDQVPASGLTRGAERSGLLERTSDEAGMGKLVGFYAVDSLNLAYERPFELADFQQPLVGKDGLAPRMGTFSNFLNRALTSGNAQTFEQLFQEVVAGIAADPQSTNSPRPVADGDLSLVLPGRKAGGWRVKALLEADTLRIPAGVFQGFDVKAGVTVYDPDNMDVAIATGRVSQATAGSSLVTSLTWLDPARYMETSPVPLPVRVTKPVTRFDYKVGRPNNIDALPAEQRARIETIMAEAFKRDDAKLDVGVEVRAGDAPDLNLMTRVEDGKLWLMLPGRTLVKDEDAFGQTIYLDLDDDDQVLIAELRDAAWKLGRAERLVRIAADNRSGFGSWLNVKANMYREGERSADPKQRCDIRKLDPEERQRMRQLGAASAAGNCDLVSLSITNTSTLSDYFIAGFYVDARGGVIPAPRAGDKTTPGNCGYALSRAMSAVDNSQRIDLDMWVTTWSNGQAAPVGLERFVLLALKQDSTGLQPDLCGLAQQTLAAELGSRAATRGGEPSPLQRLIGEIGGATRGGTRGTEDLEMEAFTLELEVTP